MRVRTPLLATIVAALCLPGAGLAAGDPPDAAAPAQQAGSARPVIADPAAYARSQAGSVVAEDYDFAPAAVTIEAGDTVTWTNNGNETHTATATGGDFDTGEIAPGSSASETFADPGTYSYVCSIHSEMKGKVRVTKASSSGRGNGNGGGETGGGGGGSGNGSGGGGNGGETERGGGPAPGSIDETGSPVPTSSSLGSGGASSALPMTGQDDSPLAAIAAMLLVAGLLAGAAQSWWEWR